jgi:hypothetical protein
MPQLIYELIVISINICRLLAAELEIGISEFFKKRSLLKLAGFLALFFILGSSIGYSGGLDDGYRHALVSSYVLGH